MTWKLDFAAPIRPQLALVIATAWGLNLLMLGAAALLIHETRTLQEELPAVQRRAEVLTQRRDSEPVQLPSATDLAAMRQRVAAVNARLNAPGDQLLSLMAAVEAALPDNTRLSNFQYRASTGSIELSAEAEGAEALSALLLALERSPRFATVRLKRQGRAAAGGVQFDLLLQERS